MIKSAPKIPLETSQKEAAGANPFEDSDFSTPMMLQYMEIKAQYQDCILFFRLGDFYEMFLEDAKVGAEVLGITLTARARGKDGRIPMAGVPFHAAEGYIAKLTLAGYKVAICDQLTPPDGRTLVERSVVRIVTPGTVTDEKVLPKSKHNYLLSISTSVSSSGKKIATEAIGLALTDLTTGDVFADQIDLNTNPLTETLNEIMTRFQPSEFLISAKVPVGHPALHFLGQQNNLHRTVYDGWTGLPSKAQTQIQRHFHLLDKLSPLASIAVANLLEYITYTQKTPIHHLRDLSPIFQKPYLKMDRSTIANLELTESLYHQAGGSLLQVLDQTVTPMGGRLLRQWLIMPLIEKAAIEARLNAVGFLKKDASLRKKLREMLSEVGDIERTVSRISLQQGSPKDLKALAVSLQKVKSAFGLLCQKSGLPELLKELTQQCGEPTLIVMSQIEKTLLEIPPFDARQGNLVRTGVSAHVDRFRATALKSREWIAQLEQSERKTTGISSLKIKFNQVFGFFIEVSHANRDLVPAHYVRKQTLVNAERFITPELRDHERIILAAEEEMASLEYGIFLELVAEVVTQIQSIQMTAKAVATLDCLLSFAEVAVHQHYTQPVLHSGTALKLEASRHPVVEKMLPPTQPFVPNDVTIDPTKHQLLLITGPNMAGKSVLMRQVALITLMTHIGSFVPADRAEISITDRIFVRSGAADMITSGLSTFMVEMVETAHILRHATAKSLVIMDEIGRGTSTYDGISIAWAVAEYLITSKNKKTTLAVESTTGPKTLFATHYHELPTMAEKFPDAIENFHMAITQHHGKPVFLYTLASGAAEHSFGIVVAELAGLPPSVIENAQQLLHQLEENHPHTPSLTPENITAQVKKNSAVISKLRQLSPDQVTPLQALALLTKWHKQLTK